MLDALGNRVLTSSASITLAIANNPSAGVLSGTASVSAVNGVAGFPMMSINKSGAAYTLGATSTGLTAATSAAFTINPGAAAGLAFSVQPTSATSTVAITPAIQVAVIDALANRVTTSTANITLAIANNPPGTGILSGTATAAAASGVATFTGLSIDKAGAGYTLAASSIGLTGATSAAFTITTGLAARLAILGTPVTVAALDCSPVRTVQLQDLGGNPVNATGNLVLNAYLSAPGSASTAFFSNAGCTTASAAGNRTITSGSNQVSFHFLAQNATATLTLVTSAGSLISGTQDATITAAIPKDLAFTTAAPSIEAGFCQALTLERQDLLGRPTSPTSVTPVALGVTPTTGMLFFTDSTCTTPLAVTFNIGAGASSTVLYAKGVSGSISATVIPGVQVYDLTASSTGLGDGVLGVTVAPMVRRRSAACTLAGATITCPITPTLTDISRTMLFFQATPSSSDDTSSDDNVTCLLELNAGAARVACERVGNAQNVDIEWQTVSFAYPYTSGGVTVQHVTGGCTALAAASTPIDINLSTTAPTTESFVLFSSRSTGTINDGQDFYTSQLTTSTTLRVSQSENTGVCAATMGFAAQVVSWAGATVNRLVSPGGPAASFPVSQATVPGSPTFLLYTSRMTGDIGFNDNICRRRLRGIISNASTLTFDRGCVGADIQDISWEHVRLPAGATVQPLGGAIASGSTTNAVTVPTAVDLTRSFSFIGGLGQGGSASGRTDYVTDDRVGSALARARLTSTTQLTFSRTSNSGNGLWQGYVVQLTP